MKDAYIKFLPSEHGNGFTGTIRHDLGATFDGWQKWYAHLRGIAEYPPEWFIGPKQDPWVVEAVSRLKEQGVEFV
jgi:hypothetical protein